MTKPNFASPSQLKAGEQGKAAENVGFSRWGSDGVDKALHAFVVRPFPVDPATGWADVKFVEKFSRSGRQPMLHILLEGGLEQRIAAQAALKRRHCA